jgi:hypothetical protein
MHFKDKILSGTALRKQFEVKNKLKIEPMYKIEISSIAKIIIGNCKIKKLKSCEFKG